MSEPIAGSSHCELIFYKCRSNNRARKWALYRVRSSPVSRTATTGESCICNAMHSYFTHTLLGIDLPVSFNFKQVQVRSGPRTPKEEEKKPHPKSALRLTDSNKRTQFLSAFPSVAGNDRNKPNERVSKLTTIKQNMKLINTV